MQLVQHLPTTHHTPHKHIAYKDTADQDELNKELLDHDVILMCVS